MRELYVTKELLNKELYFCSNIVKNCASAAGIVAGIFAYFKEMCNNT